MEGMIVIFQGPRGCGKTLSLVAEALEFHKKGWDIISNFKTSFSTKVSDEFILGLDKKSTIKNCVILIDELQIFFDSRTWSHNKSIKFSNFIQQIRKRNIILMGTTQYVDTVEKRIRQHIDILIRPTYDEESQICTCYVYDLTSLEGSTRICYYRYYFFSPPIFSLYDTYALL